jgi:hypothetical protein
MKLIPLIFLLTACTADPLRRERDEFPPKAKPGSDHITRHGFVFHNGGIAYRFEF